MDMINRRRFLAGAAAPLLGPLSPPDRTPYPQSDIIRGVRWLTKPQRYAATRGDVWESTWAEDGQLYAVADDTKGVNGACNNNLAIHRIEGAPPDHKVVTLNCMTEYGGLAQYEGLDTWKGNGLVAVDGVLYLAVSQHSHAGDYPDNIQRVYDASIVKSTDHGKTWSGKPRVGQPMFPTSRFATPFFVQFGQDYRESMDDYVYAVSNSGTWNNGNYMVLGRVRRDRIGRLDPADWEFFRGKEGEEKPAWSKRMGQATAIFRHRGFTSMTGMHYVPAFRRFVLTQWAYTDLDGAQSWKHTMLCLYEAPKPWGPWRHVHTEPEWGIGYYNPSLPSKWFEDGGRRLWITAAGDFTDQSENSSYCLIVQKMEFVYG
jgi:hypothetical protein